MTKYFSLPGYWEHLFEIQALLEYRAKYPEKFYEDRDFNNAYGMPPHLIWNGGRLNDKDTPYINYKNVFKYYREVPNFILRHTCTNSMLEPKHIKDAACNEFFNNYVIPKDYIIINSLILYDYLKQKIPEEQFIWSTTLNLDDLEIINKLSESQIFVLSYQYNNDNKYISQLKHPENIEVICMEPCLANCPKRSLHYRSFSRKQLGLPLEEGGFIDCPFSTDITIQDALRTSLSREHAVSNARVEELSNMGIQYFKISGRLTNSDYFLYMVCYYAIKKEYMPMAFQELLHLTQKRILKNKILSRA